MLQITIETPTSRRIQKARTALVLDHPFFGSLLFRLKGFECRFIQTMATDGVSLYYNPDFVETLNAATLAGTLALRSCIRRCTIMCAAPGAALDGPWHPTSGRIHAALHLNPGCVERLIRPARHDHQALEIELPRNAMKQTSVHSVSRRVSIRAASAAG